MSISQELTACINAFLTLDAKVTHVLNLLYPRWEKQDRIKVMVRRGHEGIPAYFNNVGEPTFAIEGFDTGSCNVRITCYVGDDWESCSISIPLVWLDCDLITDTQVLNAIEDFLNYQTEARKKIQQEREDREKEADKEQLRRLANKYPELVKELSNGT